jgi:hypothetical protein
MVCLFTSRAGLASKVTLPTGGLRIGRAWFAMQKDVLSSCQSGAKRTQRKSKRIQKSIQTPMLSQAKRGGLQTRKDALKRAEVGGKRTLKNAMHLAENGEAATAT